MAIVDGQVALAADFAWQDYAPTVTGITIGNGTIAGRYVRIGRTIVAEVLVTLGTTSAVTGAVTITVPVTSIRNKLLGCATARPTGAGSNYMLQAYSSAASTLVAIGGFGAGGATTSISATSPATWAATGWLLMQVTYEAAA